MNYRSKRKKRPLRYYAVGGYTNPYSGYNPTLDTSISPSSGFGSGQLGTSQMMPQSTTSIGAYDTGNFDTASYFGGDSAGGGGGMDMGSYGNYIAAATQAAGRLGTMDHENAEVEDYVDVVQEGVAAAIPIAGIFHGISETGSNIARTSMGSTSPDKSALENAEIEVERAKAGDISGFFFQPHTLITKLATGQTESAKAEENLQRIRENMVTRTTGRSSALGGDIGGSIARGQTIGASADPLNLGYGSFYNQVYRTGGFEKVYGPSHENGGVPKDLDEDGVIDSELEGGEIIEEMRGGGRAPKKYIWSDHLKTGGMSFAKKFEQMKKKGARPRDIEKLRVEQELAAKRDPSKLYAKYGGMMKYKGGGISIDPAKRGTFKAQATRMGMGVQEAASKILSAPEGKYSPEMRRKANFAKNFAKRDGGMMHYMEKGGKLPKDVLKSRLESHMSEGEVQNYLDSYKGGGLWANIHAKRKRIAAGSGEKMRKPGSEGAPTEKALRESKRDGGYLEYKKGGFKSPAWTRKEGQSPTGGLNAKGRASAKAEGSNLKAPVSSGTNPRRVSFAARFAGMEGPMKDEKGRPTRKALALKKWGFGSVEAARNFANRHKKSARDGGLMKYQLGGEDYDFSALDDPFATPPSYMERRGMDIKNRMEGQTAKPAVTKDAELEAFLARAAKIPTVGSSSAMQTIPVKPISSQIPAVAPAPKSVPAAPNPKNIQTPMRGMHKQITPEMIKESQMIASGLQKAAGPSASATANQKALAEQRETETKKSTKNNISGDIRKYAPYALAGAGALAQLGAVASIDADKDMAPALVSEMAMPEKEFLTRVKDTGKAGREARYRSTIRSIENEVGPQRFAIANQANIELTRQDEEAKARIDQANVDIDRAEKVLNTSRADTTRFKNAEIRRANAESVRNEAIRKQESINNKKFAIANIIAGASKDALAYMSAEDYARAMAGDRGVMNRFYKQSYDSFERKYKKNNPTASPQDIYSAFLQSLG